MPPDPPPANDGNKHRSQPAVTPLDYESAPRAARQPMAPDYIARTTTLLVIHLALGLGTVVFAPLSDSFSGTFLGASFSAIFIMSATFAVLLWPIALLVAVMAMIDYVPVFRLRAVRNCLIVCLLELLITAGIVLVILRAW